MLQYRPSDFYEKNGVITLLGRKAVRIDPAAGAVKLEDGMSVPYDKLCICTGSRPFVPPMSGLDTVENKTSFMTLDDAKHLDAMLGSENDKRVLIIGAGLIGLKCAEGIYQRVKELTVIDLAPRILPNVLTEVPASIIQKHIESKGVKFLLEDSVEQFEPNTAHLKSGKTIDFDVLVVAVGVRPNTELAAEAGCEVNRGILTDACSATTVPGLSLIHISIQHCRSRIGRNALSDAAKVELRAVQQAHLVVPEQLDVLIAHMGQRRVDLRLRRDMRMVGIDAPQVGQRRERGVKRAAGQLGILHRRLDGGVGVRADRTHRPVRMVEAVDVAVLPRTGERGFELVDPSLALHRDLLRCLFVRAVGGNRHEGVHGEEIRRIALRLRCTAGYAQKQHHCRQKSFHTVLPVHKNTVSL